MKKSVERVIDDNQVVNEQIKSGQSNYFTESELSKSTINKTIIQIATLFKSIPITYRYILPLLILTINILQLSKINIINSYQLSMDPYYILDTGSVEWWRVLTYVVAIDSSGSGIRDILANIVQFFICGYCVAKICNKELQRSTITKKIPQNGELNSETTLQEQNNSQIHKSKQIIVTDMVLFQRTTQIFWTKILFIQSIIGSLIISLINCGIWFIWTRFGPHTYVSIGFLPLVYYYLMKLTFMTKQQYGFELFFLPFKMKNKYKGYLAGLILMLFSMEAQSILLVMIYFILFK